MGKTSAGNKTVGPSAVLLAALLTLAVTLTVTLTTGAAPGAAEDGKARLTEDFMARLAAYPGLAKLPEADRARGLKCLVDAFVADIPEDVAGQLADMVEKKIPADKPLAMRWLVIEKGDNPERNAQVKARVHEGCPDLEGVFHGG